MDKQKSQLRPLDGLKEHPRQAEIFGDLPDVELDALAADMAKKGQRSPIEILPDGTIITGHQRVRAARKLGWEAVEVIVRRDLVAAGPAQVEELFISDNLRRRQLGPLAKARCIERLMAIQAGDKSWGLSNAQKEFLKTAIGEQLGLSIRSVNRYLLILKTPPAVQAAFDRGALPLTVAGKVALATKKVRAEVARRIEAGDEPKRVVAECLGTGGGPAGDDPDRAFLRLIRALRREVPQIAGHAERIRAGRLPRTKADLRKARRLLSELIERAG